MQHSPWPELYIQPAVKQHGTSLLFQNANIPLSKSIGSRVTSLGGCAPQALLERILVQSFVDKFFASITMQPEHNLAFVLCLNLRDHTRHSFSDLCLGLG